MVQSSVVKFNGFCWVNLPSLIEARCGAAAAFFQNHLYVFGGEQQSISNTSPNEKKFCNNFEIFDGKWSSERCPIEPRSYCAAKAVGKKIYLIGGYTTEVNFYHCEIEACNETIAFSPMKGKWKHVGNLQSARASFGCEVLHSKIYVFGGCGNSSSCLDNAEVFHVNQKIWVSISNTSVPEGFVPTCVISSGLYFLDAFEEELWKFQTASGKDNDKVNRHIPCKGDAMLLIPLSQRYLDLQRYPRDLL